MNGTAPFNWYSVHKTKIDWRQVTFKCVRSKEPDTTIKVPNF